MKTEKLQKSTKRRATTILKRFVFATNMTTNPDCGLAKKTGQIALIGDYYVDMDTIVTDVNNDAPRDEFIRWYDYCLRAGILGIPTPSFRSWLQGCPVRPEEDLARLEEIQGKIEKTKVEFEKIVKNKTKIEKDYIELLDLRLDKGNLSVAGKEYFTRGEAQEAVKAAGKRLPTCDEWDDLWKLPHAWDEDKKGMWLAEIESDLRNPDKSIFLPAAGYRINSNGSFNKRHCCGYYWSVHSNDGTSAAIGFNSSDMHAYTTTHANGLSIRCVAKSINN